MVRKKIALHKRLLCTFVISTMLLAGCGKDVRESVESVQTESFVEEEAKEVVSKEESSVEASTETDVEEETPVEINIEAHYPPVEDSALRDKILADYADAYGYWMWFAGAAPMNSDYVKEEENCNYYAFDYPGITTMDELKKFLRTRFTDEIIESKLEGDFFREYDGRLYVMDAARGSNIFIDHVDYEVYYNVEKSEGEIAALIYRHDFDDKTGETYLTGEVDVEYIRFNIEDDGAVFSTFPTIW